MKEGRKLIKAEDVEELLLWNCKLAGGSEGFGLG
jgi:hypothetical protein